MYIQMESECLKKNSKNCFSKYQIEAKLDFFLQITHLLVSVLSTLCYFWLLKRPIIFDSMINSEWCLGTILKRSNLFTFFFFTHAPKWSICYLASWNLGCNCNPRTLVSEHWVCTSLIFLHNYVFPIQWSFINFFEGQVRSYFSVWFETIY